MSQDEMPHRPTRVPQYEPSAKELNVLPLQVDAVYDEFMQQREHLLLTTLRRVLQRDVVEPSEVLPDMALMRNRGERFETVYWRNEPLILWHDPEIVSCTTLDAQKRPCIEVKLVAAYRVFK